MSPVRRRAVDFLLLLALCTALHLPGLVVRLFNSDEASLASMAMVLDHGGTMYHQTGDRKPPVVPYLYATVFKLTGTRDLRPVRGVAIVSLAATAALLGAEAERRFGGGRRRFLVCGGIFLASSAAFFPADSQAAGFEIFMLLPMTAAVVFASRGRAVLAGAALAVAALCKQTAIITALPIAALLAARGWRPVARAGAACSAVLIVTAMAFGPASFFLWTVSGNRGYLSLDGPVVPMMVRGVAMTAAFVGANLGVAVLLRRRRWVQQPDLWLWLAGGALAVLAGLRFFGHYYLQLVPPMALLAAGGLELERWRGQRLALAGVALPSAGFLTAAFLAVGFDATASYPTVADKVRELTRPGDTMFVWGQLPELYWASGVEPGTRFVHTGFLTGNSGGRAQGLGHSTDGLPGAWAMLRSDLQVRLPTLIVDTGPAHVRGSEHYPLQQTSLWPVIVHDYTLVTTVDHVDVYRVANASSHVHFATRTRPSAI